MTRLFSSIEQVLLFLLVLGVVVAFHELGHFLTAKAFRVRVDVFSLGFGPAIWKRRRGETEYRVAAIPLGGYVLMGGEMGEEDPSRPRDGRDFEAQSVGARLAILGAGPVFSALLAVLIMWGAFLAGVEVPAWLHQRPAIGTIQPGSPAASSGLLPGDLVLTASGRPTPTWETFTEIVLTSPGARLDLEVERAGERLIVPVDVQPAGKHRIGWLGALPCSSVVARSVAAGSPAEGAGLRPGDVLASVDGAAPCTESGLVTQVQASEGRELDLLVRRGGEELAIRLAPRHDAASDRWLIGIAPGIETAILRHGLLASLVESVRYNADKSMLVVETLGKLVTGRLSVRALSGPLEMASMTQETAEIGFLPLVQFVALITLNLAIFNLLPIPILDGGRILLLVIEAVRGRDLERRTKDWILQAGLAMIVLLMVVVLVFDAIKKLEG